MPGNSPIIDRHDTRTGVGAVVLNGSIWAALIMAFLLLSGLSSTVFASMSSPSGLGFEIMGNEAQTYSTTTGTSKYPYKVHLKWTDNSSDEDYYLVEVMVRKDTWVTVGTAVFNEFIDTIGIAPGKSYKYRVSAYREIDNTQSGPSNIVTVTTPVFNLPTAPDHTTCICQGNDPASCTESDTGGGGGTSELPNPPTGIWATAGDTQVSISWLDGVGSTSTTLMYGTAPGVYSATIDNAVSTHIIYSLTNGQTIYFKVGAKNETGTMLSAEYSVTPVLPPPSAPDDISSVAGDTQATISWSAAAGSSSYFITYGTTAGVYTTTIDPAAPGSAISGLTNGQTVYYRVWAKNAGGNTASSEYSVTPMLPLPSAPTGISHYFTNSNVSVSWTPGAGSTSSTLLWSLSPGINGINGTTPPVLTNPEIITCGISTYCYYQVGAVNAAGTTWSPEYSVRTGQVVYATSITSIPGFEQVTIYWSGQLSSIATSINYGTGGVYTTNSINPVSSPLTITGLTNGAQISYRLSFRSGIPPYAWYEKQVTYTVTPDAAAPAAPASASVSATAGNGQVTISWSAGAGAATSLIEYGTASGVYATTIDPAASPITISGLTNGQTVYYRVGSKNAGGTRITWSNEISVTPVLPPPAAPTVMPAAAGNGQATISWTAGTGSTSSLVRYGATIDNYTTTIDPAASPRLITGLTNGQTIHYQVGAKNAASTTWSEDYSVTPMAPPAAATGISAAAGNTQATIFWTAGTGSTSLIKYGTATGVYTTTIDPAVSGDTIFDLTNGETIFYRVGSRTAVGTTWSAESRVTPGTPP